ncbi:TPM domain-containing protein [Lactobacillus gasseri]|uniref:TPM domain-containing protein n=1 Tax=Lactobacillus gasseri TaxID=1596 RepID=UPI000C7A9964|nr:TPM domain-containing protein [Lactobacillus gasseri]MDX5108420.1 TPM domain-containing protein [Lactobacillus gasseri]PKZ72264.1 hypothetical protein CYJ88_07260 [Lactobacillus gasseri]PMB87438.1 hypothetical protein CK796_07245 [Lactobacillus gasseri]
MSIKRKFSLIVLTFLTPLVLLAAFNNQCFADDTDSNDNSFLRFDDSDDDNSDPFSLFFSQETSYVLDKAGIINDDTQEYINDVNDNLLSTVKGKPIIAVITSKDCHGEDIADYSQKMFDKYHFGKGKLNNGVLIVINKEDYQVRVQTGYGMESILPDAYLNKTIVKAFTKETKSRIINKGNGQSGGGGASATVNVAGEELVHHKTYSQGTKELVNLIVHRITDKLPTQSNKDSKSKSDKADVTFAELSDMMAICIAIFWLIFFSIIAFKYVVRN